MSEKLGRPDPEPCGECFALVRPQDLERHMEWHRYAAPVQRAGPLLAEAKREAAAEESQAEIGR